MQISIQALRDAVGVTAIVGHNTALEVSSSRGNVPLEGTLTIAGVRTDSRQVEAGDMFVCIAGDRFDGHNFAADVAARGAVVLLAERDPFVDMSNDARPSVIVLIVPDAVLALGKLANWYRHQSKAKVIGITGTAGKTTVKELLAHVLSSQGTVAKNPLNLNNQIGLPLSMLAATGHEDFWVMEAGISEARDMDELGAILQPDFALILNVGQGHTLGLGQRGVAHYKSLLLSYLMDKGSEKGQALVSADYDDLVREARSQCRNITFFSATGKPLTYRAAYMGVAESGDASHNNVEDFHDDADVMHGRYRVWLDGVAQEIVAPFRGAFGAENVIAVAAMAHMLGLSGNAIAKAFTTATLPKQRFACKRIGSCIIIDDTYNANPLSMKCMVEAVVEMKVGTPSAKNSNLTFVLGEMLELGSEAEKAHQDLGRLLATTEASAIYWKGGNAEAVASGLRHAGYGGHFAVVEDAAHCLELMAEHGMPHGHILFKGSRGNRLERFREAFEEALI